MPHQCTSCGNIHPDGSDAILSGCEECGDRKFQFVSEDATGGSGGEGPPQPPADSSRPASDERERAEEETDDGHNPIGEPWPGEDDEQAQDRREKASGLTDGEIIEDGPEEDTAQSSARSDVLEPDEWPEKPTDVGSPPPRRGQAARDPDQVAEELNEQFGSIRVVRPGKFEIDLMNLYESDESIISIQEDGSYVIEPAGNWEQQSA